MIAVVTQARVNSTRLHNKIFLEAGDRSFFAHHITRLKTAGVPIIVATTDDGSENPIVDFCNKNGLMFFRGDEADVLKRYYQCAQEFQLTTIIRVTSDCPLIDGNIIAKGLSAYLEKDDLTYYSNVLNRSYPRGMDYEIFSFKLLKEAFENASDPGDREHVTPYIWKNRSGNVKQQDDLDSEDNSQFRITLDTVQDQILITKLIEEYQASELDCKEIVAILKKHPELIDINKMIEQKKV